MIFYFTGTGNSLYVAKQLDTELVSIPQVIKGDLHFQADTIGVVCPIYGHEMPSMVKDFLRRAEFQTGYFYLVLTYGMLHGGAAELARDYLQSVGKSADYINTIMLVDNFLPAFDMAEQVKQDKRVEEPLEKIKADLRQSKHWVQKADLKNRMVHKGYLKSVNNQPETIWAAYTVTDSCVGCGICTKVCPAGCIHLEDRRPVHDLKNCQACMACIHACPKLAIQMTISEKNPRARYRNEHISLQEIVSSNNQMK